MTTNDQITKLLTKTRSMSATSMADAIGVSRQAISKQLQRLVSSGIVVKHGTTKGASFELAKPGSKVLPKTSLKRSLTLQGLQEDQVFTELSGFLSLRKQVSASAFDILHFAFTELLNNAIEHSKSRRCQVEFTLDAYNAVFKIIDSGIGVFHSIRSGFRLADENAAIAELLKGKTTTMDANHSGEGIFFSSRSADEMSLRSHQAKLIFSKTEEDSRIEACRFLSGTTAHFTISRRSKRKLNDIFLRFAPAEFDHSFMKTQMLVRLQTAECISRSTAKRMISRLEKFKQVILDFKHVKILGQGFADETFRVFLQNNPEITIQIRNLKPTLHAMVRHALNDKTVNRVSFL